MVWLPAALIAATAAQAAAPPPPTAYPGVHAVRVQTGSGVVTYYTVPPDAPPEVRAALKTAEFADRDLLLAEQLQGLKQDIVRSERGIEALRLSRALNGQYPYTLGPGVGNGVFYPPGGVRGGSGGGYGNGFGGPGNYGLWGWSPFATDSAVRSALAANLSAEAAPDAAREAIARQAAARQRMQELRPVPPMGGAFGRPLVQPLPAMGWRSGGW